MTICGTELKTEGPHDERYHDGLSRYRLIYESDTLSSRPRLEVLVSAFVFIVTVGTIWSILGRLEPIGFFGVYVAYSFLIPLAYHLRHATMTAIFLIDEVLYRLIWKLGYPEPFGRARSLRTAIRVYPVAIVGAMAIASGVFGWAFLVNLIFPIAEHPPYTGGG